jgi:hypothetical protein
MGKGRLPYNVKTSYHLTEFALFAPIERLVFLPVVLEQMAIDR